MVKKSALGRPGETDEQAEVAAFLASDRACSSGSSGQPVRAQSRGNVIAFSGVETSDKVCVCVLATMGVPT
jgi:hypothetical protein